MTLAHCLTILLLLLVTSTVGRGAPSVECVNIQIVEMPVNENSDGTLANITLLNRCEKDITAYRVAIHERSSGLVLRTVSQELLDSLAVSTNADILRRSASRSFAYTRPAESEILTVDAVIYADDSTAGDAKDVGALLDVRRRALLSIKDELTVLNRFLTWNDTATLREKAEQAKVVNSPSAWFLARLAKVLERSDASSWEAFTARERQRLQQTANLFEKHLPDKPAPK